MKRDEWLPDWNPAGAGKSLKMIGSQITNTFRLVEGVVCSSELVAEASCKHKLQVGASRRTTRV